MIIANKIENFKIVREKRESVFAHIEYFSVR